MEDWKEFETFLQSAVNEQLPTGAMPYAQVNVFMICFAEDDLGFDEESTSFRELPEKDF